MNIWLCLIGCCYDAFLILFRFINAFDLGVGAVEYVCFLVVGVLIVGCVFMFGGWLFLFYYCVLFICWCVYLLTATLVCMVLVCFSLLGFVWLVGWGGMLVDLVVCYCFWWLFCSVYYGVGLFEFAVAVILNCGYIIV